MSKERHPSQTGLVVSNQQGLEKRRSGLVKRGLHLIDKLDTREINILLGNHADEMNEQIEECIRDSLGADYVFRFFTAHSILEIRDVLELTCFDVFILILCNIFGAQGEASLTLVRQLRNSYRKPVIALLPPSYVEPPRNYYDPIFKEKAQQAGVSFFLDLPVKGKVLAKAVKDCLAETTRNTVHT